MFWRLLLTFFTATAVASVVRAQPPLQPQTDTLGDPLPAGAVAQLGTLRLKHNRQPTMITKGGNFVVVGEETSWITSVAFAPDGKKFASLANDELRLWDTATGKQLRGP